MPILRKRRVLALKIETTPGTAETLLAADCIFVFDADMQFDIPDNARNATGSLSKLASVPGARKATCTFSVELAGGGTGGAAPAWANLFEACGMVKATNVFTPTSNTTNYKTVTLGLYEDGRVKKMAGAMGTWSLEATSGNPGMMKFSFEGVHVAPADGTMLALPTYTMVPPRFASASFVVGSVTPKISKFNMEAGNTIKLVEDITTASGYSRAVVTDRNITGSIDPEGVLVAAWDVYGQWIAGTQQNMTLTVGSTAGNQITFDADRFQITNVQEGDRDQLTTEDISFLCTASSAGDNELTITFV